MPDSYSHLTPAFYNDDFLAIMESEDGGSGRWYTLLHWLVGVARPSRISSEPVEKLNPQLWDIQLTSFEKASFQGFFDRF